MKHSSLIQILNQFQDKKFYFEPLGGNNGDNLIEMGAEEVFRKLGIKLVDNPEAAEVIAINGSGDLSYHPVTKPIEETRQASIFSKYTDIPVILLSSSCTKENAARIAPIIEKRKADSYVFTRDAISYSHLKAIESIKTKVVLESDMAFGLEGSEWLLKLKKIKPKGTLLIVERFDAEGATSLPLVYKTPQFYRSLIPKGIKDFIKKKSLGTIHSNTSFVKEATAKAKELFPEVQFKEIKAADISLPQNHTFDEFANEIASASIVISTRLHVCILAAMLGKPFIAVQFEGGSKLKGVFENTLKDYPNSKLWIRKKG